MSRNLFLFFALITYSTLHAQNEVQGVVNEANAQSVPFATVSAWQKTGKDSTLLGGSQTNELGRFSIKNLPSGKVQIIVSFVGYQSISRLVLIEKPMTDLGQFTLKSDATLLKEVKVTGEKEAMTMSTEKRIFNVGKNLTAIGGTAESLLRNIPSITLDESGSPSLRNMATAIYINGKPTQLTLAQIPANQIESVEVISNPSARYDASTSGGIVNLILKRNQKPGYNGTASVGIGNNSRYDATVNLDLRQGKWNFTTLYSLNATQNPLNGYVNRTNLSNGLPTSYFNQNTDIALNNTFQNGRVVADYLADAKNTFSLAATLVGGAYNTISSQNYSYKDAAQTRTSYGSRDITPKNNFTNLGIEFDWKHGFAQKGRELNLMTSFTRNNISNAADWLTTSLNADGSSQATYPETNRVDGRTIGSQYIAQLDYVHPTSDSSKWEFGIRSFTFNRDQQYFFYQQNNDTKAYNLLQNYSQFADISETVNAVYALYTTKLRNNISVQGGLRLEQSSLHGLSKFDGSTFGYDYPSKAGQNLFQSFFPSFSLTKKLRGDSELGLSLSRKVGRPNFRHVFVGIQANDRQNITIGNPAVRPEFVNTAELAYDKNWANGVQLVSTAYYIYEDHTIKPFTQPSAADPSILVTTFVNVKADIQYGLEQTLKFDVGKSLSVLASTNLRNFVIQSDEINTALWGINTKLSLTYRFPGNFTAQLTANRDSRSPSLQGYRLPVSAADFALRKSFWQKRASVVFSINDIFNSRKFVSVYDQSTVYQASMNRREIRFYKITLQIPLGKPDATFKKNQRKIDRPDVDFSN